MKKLIPVIIITFSLLLLISCDGGISPRPVVENPGFSGTITFTGEWPENVQRTLVVMFKEPLATPEDFSIVNIRYIGSEIPYGSETFQFISNDNYLDGEFEPGDYAYLAVAQSTTPVLSLERSDWYVIGVYSNNSEQSPAVLTLSEGMMLTGINISCDFNNPPPQPPGGN